MRDNNTVFQAPDFENHSPLTWYQAAREQPGFIDDMAQLRAIRLLDKLWAELMMFKRKRNRFLGRSLRSPQAPKGLYFYGGVGRGKSFLMDIFYGCLLYRRKRRVHFHAFMADVHRRMQEHKGQEDPLRAVAAEIAVEVRVLCFDEFHVSDIADAMILGRLLEGLFAEGVVLVATSNYMPSELYPQGQNRSSFLPAIALIEKELTVLRIDGGRDYRHREALMDNVYYEGEVAETDPQLSLLFKQLTGENATAGNLGIHGRKVAVRGMSQRIIWFDFNVLCGDGRSQNDYLWLAENYGSLLLSGVPVLSESDMAKARRFTWLVDILYDYRVKLSMGLAASPDMLYTQGDFAGEFVRTASRLNEMQSQSYRALEHLLLKGV